MKYLLDPVILIDHFNGVNAATQFLAEHGPACAISVITRAEVLAGFDEKKRSPRPVAPWTTSGYSPSMPWQPTW